jgi:hypothetical protein
MMKRFAICALGALLVGCILNSGTVRADDDVDFATPVVTNSTPACADGSCAVATETVIARRRPVLNWFQERRPVRRVLRGAVRFVVGRRCCS